MLVVCVTKPETHTICLVYSGASYLNLKLCLHMMYNEIYISYFHWFYVVSMKAVSLLISSLEVFKQKYSSTMPSTLKWLKALDILHLLLQSSVYCHKASYYKKHHLVAKPVLTACLFFEAFKHCHNLSSYTVYFIKI